MDKRANGADDACFQMSSNLKTNASAKAQYKLLLNTFYVYILIFNTQNTD